MPKHAPCDPVPGVDDISGLRETDHNLERPRLTPLWAPPPELTFPLPVPPKDAHQDVLWGILGGSRVGDAGYGFDALHGALLGA